MPGPSRRQATGRPLPGITPQFAALPARPFAVAVSPGGEHAFVSMPRAGGRGLVSLSARTAAPWQVERVTWVAPSVIPRGIALDDRGRYALIVDGAGGLMISPTADLLAGQNDPIVSCARSPGSGSTQLVLHRDQRYAFVSDEDTATLSVYDLDESLASGAPSAKLIGQVPVPAGPVGVACAHDGHHLFVTSQAEGPDGMLSVIGVAQAVQDPAQAKVMSAPAGCQPVRVTVSPDDSVVWATARGSNALLGFDAERLIAGRERALRTVVRVGSLPVGLALLAGGSLVVVANSNRYGSDREQPQTLAVIDAEAALAGRKALLGSVPAGAFPRELAALPDDRTVLVTNVFSQSLEAVRVC